MNKLCVKCGIRKRDYTSGQCRLCHNAYCRQLYNQNLPKSRERNKAARDRRRLVVVKMLGDKCVHCGMTDQRCLQIDHIDGGGVRESRSLSSTGIIAKAKRLKGKGYQLLCSNCNWIKRDGIPKERGVVSQTI